MYLLHTARALPILCTCVQYWAPTRPICFVRGLIFATFCYFLLLFATFLLLFATFCYFLALLASFFYLQLHAATLQLLCVAYFTSFCYFLLLSATFCYFLLLFATFCYFLLLFATFCYFLLLFAVKSYLPLTALLDTTAPRYFTLLYTTISSKRKKT